MAFLVALACLLPPLLFCLDYHFDSDQKQSPRRSSTRTMEVRRQASTVLHETYCAVTYERKQHPYESIVPVRVRALE